MLRRTRTALVYGNPGERRTIPAGTRVRAVPASNLSDGGYWIEPENPADVAPSVIQWAEDVGCFAFSDDLEELDL